jgi:signal peptidase I
MVTKSLKSGTSSQPTSNPDLFNSREMSVLKSVLESGLSVELPATGYSMFPTLRPGDRVVVRPLSKGELPERGSVVVYLDKGAMAEGGRWKAEGKGQKAQGEGLRAQRWESNNILVMHRLVEIKKDDSGNYLFITRGDSMMELDITWSQQQLIGVAVSYKRGRKEYPVKKYIPLACKYKYNKGLLWVAGKIMRLSLVFDILVWSRK